MATFAFLGAGNMGGALARAARRSLPPEELFLSDPNHEQITALAAELGCRAGSAQEAAAESRFLFLGVKPHVVGDLLASLQPALTARGTPPVLVSMAAGVTLAQLTELCGVSCPIIRIMPNTPAACGKGTILYAHNALVTEEDLAAFLHGMAGAGGLYPLAESLIDAGSSLSGCGPAFFYLFADALADGGVACGLSRADAIRFAAQTMLGAAEMILTSPLHPEALKNAVCSPGGSTILGVRVLEQQGVRAAAMDAVMAAFEKNRALGQS